METDLSFWRLFSEASLLVQGVMCLLLLISLLSWKLIFQRGAVLRRANQALMHFREQFRAAPDLNKLYDYISVHRNISGGMENIIKAGFKDFIKSRKQVSQPVFIMQSVERALRVALNKEEQLLEKHLSFLASVGAISVYVGLFGTVWGIMNAFRSLGAMQQATLAMVAPGISEALVATALGLFAAIPAVYAYNRYTHRVQAIVQDYDNLTEEFYGLLEYRVHTQKPEDLAL